MNDKKYTLLETAIGPDVPKDAKLKLISTMYHPNCAGSGVALFSNFSSYISMFKDKTGIGLGEPITSSKKLLSEDDIRELNLKVHEMKGMLKNLCKCIADNKE